MVLALTNMGDLYTANWDATAIGSLISRGGWTPQQYRILIGYFIKTKEWRQAEDVLTRALEEYPNSLELHATFGDILAAKGMYEEARDEWTHHLIKFTGARTFLDARLAWLAIRLGDINTARDIIAVSMAKRHPDMMGCQYLVDPRGNRLNLEVLKGGTEVIVDHAHLVCGLAQGKPEEVSKHYPYAGASLAIWCPEAIPQAIVRFYQALLQGNKIQEEIVDILGSVFFIVPLLAARSSSDLRYRLRILRKGLNWHPTNQMLLEEYASIHPNDNWLLKHMEKHRLAPPASIIETLNTNFGGGKLLNASFLATYKHDNIDLELNALGGADGIGASAYVLTYRGKSLLLDCGLDPRKTGPRAYPDLDRWLGDIHAIVISHGHLDHCGALPKAHNQWPRAPIFCTETTRDFARLLFEDMLRIRRWEHGRETYADTIEKEEMDRTLKGIQVIPYNEWVEVFAGCRIRLHPGGHVPGAAMIEIEWYGLRIIYTGDFCLHDQQLVKGARPEKLPVGPDLLISEATYASKLTGFSWDNQLQELRQAIFEVLIHQGTVLLPSFAVGRSQELVAELADLSTRGLLPNNPSLYISGLAYEACKRLAAIDTTFSQKMASFKYIHPDDVICGNSVIVASSGMMASGSASARIAETLRKATNSGIFFCGYLDEEAERENNLSLKTNSNNIKIARYSLSAHASSQDLIKLITLLRPRALVMVHWGESRHDIQENYLERLRLMVLNRDCLTWVPQRNLKILPCSPFYWLKNRLKGVEAYARG